MAIRCALAIDDNTNIIEADFLEIPRVGEHIRISGELQDLRVTGILHQVHNGAGQPSIRIDATTKIL